MKTILLIGVGVLLGLLVVGGWRALDWILESRDVAFKARRKAATPAYHPGDQPQFPSKAYMRPPTRSDQGSPR